MMIDNPMAARCAMSKAAKNSMKVFYICPDGYLQKLWAVSLTIRDWFPIPYFFLDVLNFEDEILFGVDAFGNCHLLCKYDYLVTFVEIVPEDVDVGVWSVHKFPIIWILRKLLTRFRRNDCWVLKNALNIYVQLTRSRPATFNALPLWLAIYVSSFDMILITKTVSVMSSTLVVKLVFTY